MRLFAGGADAVTFDNTTYVSENETGHQNYAIAHFLKQNKVNKKSIHLIFIFLILY